MRFSRLRLWGKNLYLEGYFSETNQPPEAKSPCAAEGGAGTNLHPALECVARP